MNIYRFVEIKENRIIIQKKGFLWGWNILTEDGFGFGEDDSCPLEFKTLIEAMNFIKTLQQKRYPKIIQTITYK